MKLAVTGKGGVGKTLVSAALARSLCAHGQKVYAIDADPDSNLAACLGHAHPETIRPLIELKELIEERTGVKPGTTGGMFRLNPFVQDLPDKYSVEIDGVHVMVAGAVKKGGAGCYCPENTLVRALISHLLLDKDTALVMDMEAGIEHLGRGTVRAVDHLLIVVEPGRRSLETALRIKGLAADIGLKRVSAVGNKIRTKQDQPFMRKMLPGFEFAAFLPYDPKLVDAEVRGKSVPAASPVISTLVDEMVKQLKVTLEKSS